MAPILFNLALEYMMRKLSTDRNSTLEDKMVQILGYADDINIISRSQGRAKETFQELKGEAEEIRLQVNKTKIKQRLWSPLGRKPGNLNILKLKH